MKKLKILKKTRINNLLSIDDKYENALILGVVCLLSVLIMFCGSLCFGQELLDLSTNSDKKETTVNTIDRHDEPPFNRIIDMNGVVGIDGSLRVLEANYTKIFDLVEVSTPVVAAANHARLFLRADGTKQSLMISWDDGTYTRLAGN